MEKEKTTPLGKSEGAEPERFIPDGMGMFQRNVKRIGDCALAFLALIVFSPLSVSYTHLTLPTKLEV